MSDKLSSPFPISPKVRGCLFAAPSHWELCKQGVAAGTFSRWQTGQGAGAGSDRCPAPACSRGLCRGGKLPGLHPGWLALPPCPDVPREAKWLWRGPLCWHDHFQQTKENAFLLKLRGTLWGPRGCKSTCFFFFLGCAMRLWYLSSQPGIEPRPSMKAQSPNHWSAREFSMPPAPTTTPSFLVCVGLAKKLR